MPYLFAPQIESLPDGVARLYTTRRGIEAQTPYAELNTRILV